VLVLVIVLVIVILIGGSVWADSLLIRSIIMEEAIKKVMDL